MLHTQEETAVQAARAEVRQAAARLYQGVHQATTATHHQAVTAAAHHRHRQDHQATAAVAAADTAEEVQAEEATAVAAEAVHRVEEDKEKPLRLIYHEKDSDYSYAGICSDHRICAERIRRTAIQRR
jgi:hypothetical protein